MIKWEVGRSGIMVRAPGSQRYPFANYFYFIIVHSLSVSPLQKSAFCKYDDVHVSNSYVMLVGFELPTDF